jgi:hypothetical protein
VTSIGKLTDAPPMAETPARPASPGQEGHLAAEQIGQPTAEQQQAAERQGVGGDHPLPVRDGEVQCALRRRQRDVHHGTSRTAMSCAMQITARTSQRRRSMRGAMVIVSFVLGNRAWPRPAASGHGAYGLPLARRVGWRAGGGCSG